MTPFGKVGFFIISAVDKYKIQLNLGVLTITCLVCYPDKDN